MLHNIKNEHFRSAY